MRRTRLRRRRVQPSVGTEREQAEGSKVLEGSYRSHYTRRKLRWGLVGRPWILRSRRSDVVVTAAIWLRFFMMVEMMVVDVVEKAKSSFGNMRKPFVSDNRLAHATDQQGSKNTVRTILPCTIRYIDVYGVLDKLARWLHIFALSSPTLDARITTLSLSPSLSASFSFASSVVASAIVFPWRYTCETSLSRLSRLLVLPLLH
ncbi:hypothetical protein FB451DRAFT_1265502 [Mycena latifolia]|nr:hypothetical protein FB451DRAFT_1265502 [Mycena latifolia]